MASVRLTPQSLAGSTVLSICGCSGLPAHCNPDTGPSDQRRPSIQSRKPGPLLHAGPGQGMHAVHAGSGRAQHGAPDAEAVQARPAVRPGQQRLCLLPVLLPGSIRPGRMLTREAAIVLPIMHTMLPSLKSQVQGPCCLGCQSCKPGTQHQWILGPVNQQARCWASSMTQHQPSLCCWPRLQYQLAADAC